MSIPIKPFPTKDLLRNASRLIEVKRLTNVLKNMKVN